MTKLYNVDFKNYIAAEKFLLEILSKSDSKFNLNMSLEDAAKIIKDEILLGKNILFDDEDILILENCLIDNNGTKVDFVYTSSVFKLTERKEKVITKRNQEVYAYYYTLNMYTFLDNNGYFRKVVIPLNNPFGFIDIELYNCGYLSVDCEEIFQTKPYLNSNFALILAYIRFILNYKMENSNDDNIIIYNEEILFDKFKI